VTLAGFRTISARGALLSPLAAALYLTFALTFAAPASFAEPPPPVAAPLPEPSKIVDIRVDPRGPKPESYFSAEYRFLTQGLTNIPVDEIGTRGGQRLYAEQRLKVMGQYAIPDQYLRIELGAYLFNGMLAGDTTSVGADKMLFPRNHLDAFRRYEPRRAMLAWTSTVGELRVGHQTNNWGYGILANSGENELDFDDQRLGDLVERIAFITRPFQSLGNNFGKNFYTALAFDVVYRDTNANLIDGDFGTNAILSAFYATQSTFVGFFGTFRHQVDRDDDRINVGALDLHARITRPLGAGGEWSYSLGAEGVLLVGTTSRVRPDASPQGVDVLTGGGIARFSLDYTPQKDLPSKFGFTFEAGYASGDNDSNDGTTRLHTFHSDYRVGMVLFPEVMSAMTARSSDRAGDPARVGRPPAGTENLPSNGSVQNAVYVWPRVHFRPIKGLTLRAGLLYARSVADVSTPFLSFRAGGLNRNFLDGPGDAHDLGIEVQLGVRYVMPLFASKVKNLNLHLGAEWGHLFPGAAFTDAQGNRMADVDRFIGRAMLEWKL